jgi:hypothetical protein
MKKKTFLDLSIEKRKKDLEPYEEDLPYEEQKEMYPDEGDPWEEDRPSPF